MSQPIPWLAPPSFPVDRGDAVFVQFLAADHDLELDLVDGGTALARSIIDFESFEKGFPIFDVATYQIDAARIDGCPATIRSVRSPDGITTYRTLETPIEPGRHRLEITQQPEQGITPDGDRVSLRFRFSDRGEGEKEPHYEERFFLERYLPANLEFDRHPVRLRIRIRNQGTRHVLLTNGAIQWEGKDGWVVEFPSWFCSSSPFVNVVPADHLAPAVSMSFARADGSSVAVGVVGERDHADVVKELASLVEPTLRRLEQVFGPFPFDRYLVHAVGNSGMEYAGAAASTSTPETFIHETAHNYFGRCLAPVDGDAGWVDEGIARWVENWGDSLDGEPVGKNMGRRSRYCRATAGAAWSTGEQVIGLLDREIQPEGGMRSFLRHWYITRRFDRYTAQGFQQDLETYVGRSLDDIFTSKVYSDED